MAKSLTFTEAVDRVQEWRRRWGGMANAAEGEEGAEVEEEGPSGQMAVTKL
jgi:hypothetical protein